MDGEYPAQTTWQKNVYGRGARLTGLMNLIVGSSILTYRHITFVQDVGDR